MRNRRSALLCSALLITGAMLVTGCDDVQVPQVPGVEEQEDSENQDTGYGDGQEDGQEQNEDGDE